jgi:hypothetical protein
MMQTSDPKIDDEQAARDRRVYLVLMLFGAAVQGTPWTPLPDVVRAGLESKSVPFASERDYRCFLAELVDAGIIEEKTGMTRNLETPLNALRFRLAFWLTVVIGASGKMADGIRSHAAKKTFKPGGEGSD